MKKDKIRAALLQTDSQDCWEKNRKMLEGFIQDAVRQGAEYVQLPETSDYIGTDFQGYARAHSSDASAFFSEMAARYQIWLNCGSITEYCKGQKPKNTSLFFTPDGSLLGKYSKIHMFDVDVKDGVSYRESNDIQAGDRTVLLKTDAASFGLSICYDLRFPELYRKLAAEGADILCNSANFTYETGKCHWKPLLQARAIENTCFVLAVGQCGKKACNRAYGHSMAIDPWGTVLLELGEEPDIGIIDLNLSQIASVRQQIPSLNNRRTDIFGSFF